MKKKGKTSIVIILVAVIVLAVLYFIFNGSNDSVSGDVVVPVDIESIKANTDSNDDVMQETIPEENESESTSDENTEETTTEATPAEPTVTMDQISVEVLNGTKVTGLASLAQADIEKLGYTQVSAANSNTAVAATSITYSKNIPVELITQLEKYLTEKYGEIKSVAVEPPVQPAKPQIVIVLGNPKN